MRLVLLLTAACALQGCATLVGGAIAADTNRQRRAEATTTGAGLAERLPAPGGTLTLVLVRGDTLRGAVTAATPDSLVLDSGTLSLTDIDSAERPWVRADVDKAVRKGLATDLVLYLMFALAALSSFN